MHIKRKASVMGVQTNPPDVPCQTQTIKINKGLIPPYEGNHKPLEGRRALFPAGFTSQMGPFFRPRRPGRRGLTRRSRPRRSKVVSWPWTFSGVWPKLRPVKTQHALGQLCVDCAGFLSVFFVFVLAGSLSQNSSLSTIGSKVRVFQPKN